MIYFFWKTLNSGVYTVDIDTEEHKVTVRGHADSDALIKKLRKSGKHAEIWPPNTYQNQSDQEELSWAKDGNMVSNQMENPIYWANHGDDWQDYHGFSEYMNHAGEVDHTVMTKSAVMDNVHGDENHYGANINLEDNNIKSLMMGFQGFKGNGDGYGYAAPNGHEYARRHPHLRRDLPSYANHHHPSYNMQGHHYYHPSPAPARVARNAELQNMHAMTNPIVHNNMAQMMNYTSFPPNRND